MQEIFKLALAIPSYPLSLPLIRNAYFDSIFCTDLYRNSISTCGPLAFVLKHNLLQISGQRNYFKVAIFYLA